MRLPGPDYAAPAKLNLFLHVVGRRADGYHLLQSVFALIDAADRLRFAVRQDGQVRRMSELPGVPPESDLVVRAAALLKAETGVRLGADIEVEKRLPMGGGLGGGSSDAATTLIVLNRLWGTGLDRPSLQALGGPCLLICGGHDKGLDPGPLLEGAASRARVVLTVGEEGPALLRELTRRGVTAECVGTVAAAVARAAALARPGETVLLSPGYSSHDQFTNYEARAAAFVREVLALHAARAESGLPLSQARSQC